MQSYDSRADRWVFAPDDDPEGPLSYHGAASVGFKIYIIGGFDGENYFNTCRVYDTLNRSWQEVFEYFDYFRNECLPDPYRYRQCIPEGATCPLLS